MPQHLDDAGDAVRALEEVDASGGHPFAADADEPQVRPGTAQLQIGRAHV